MPIARKGLGKSPNLEPKTIEVLYADVFAGLDWLVHGFSIRKGGVSTCYGGKALNLGMTEPDMPTNVERNQERFLRAVGAVRNDGVAWPLAEVRQIHSSITHLVGHVAAHHPAGDGMVTNVPGIALAIKTADCVPVLIADVKQRVVGAIHAGWRGTAGRVVEKGVGQMRHQFGSSPRNLRAAIGPCIRKCCYTVGAEVQAEFTSQFDYADELFEEVFDSNAIHIRYPLLFLNQRAPGHGDLGPEIHLDLVTANTRQLMAAGVRSAHISVIEGCTACDTKRFFSHRAEFGKTGRMMALIGIRTE